MFRAVTDMEDTGRSIWQGGASLCWRACVIGPLTIGVAFAQPPVLPGGLPGAAQVHPPFHGVVPSGSDVVFSTRFKRTEAMQVFTAYQGTRVEWVYSNDAAYVSQFKTVTPWFGVTLNANPKLATDAGEVRDFDGQPLAAPWMKGWGVLWASSAHPDAQAAWSQQLQEAVQLGASSIQFDDPQLQMFAANNQGGDFNPAMQQGFAAWLRSHAAPAAVKAAGLQDLGSGGSAYRDWLSSQHGVRNTADYRQRLRQLPSTPLWLAYTRHTVLQWHRQLRAQAARLAGRPVPWSMNLAGLYEPLASNSFFFLAPLADYSMAETQIKDWPLQVMQAATARALGMGFVPSIKPLSLAENRTGIASLYALGGQVVVPWDVYDGNDAQGKGKRFFGAPDDYADLYAFVRAHPALFDNRESTPVVGVVVPVDKGQAGPLRNLAQRLVAQQVPFAFVPVGGDANYRADPARLRHFALLVTTNPDADYPPDALQALAASGVQRVSSAALTAEKIADLQPFQVAPGAENLRLLPRANPGQRQHLVVHVVDAARGDKAAADPNCRRRIGLRRSMLDGAVSSAQWVQPTGTVTVTPDTASRTHVFFGLPGCALWGVLDIQLQP